MKNQKREPGGEGPRKQNKVMEMKKKNWRRMKMILRKDR